MICVPGETTFILVAEAKNGIPQMFVDWMRSADSPQDVIERYRQEGFELNKMIYVCEMYAEGTDYSGE